MNSKPTLYHFITFVLIFTVFFSSNCVEIFAEPTSEITQNAENSTETTTEAPSVIKNYADESYSINLNSRAAILMDANTGAIIYEKKRTRKALPRKHNKGAYRLYCLQ